MQVLFLFLYCTNLAAPIMAPQFSIQERNFLMMEYLKHKGSRDYKQGIIERFIEKFPNSRAPCEKTLVRVFRKQLEFGTVHNLNSKASAGDTFSGRRKTSTSDNVKVQIAQQDSYNTRIKTKLAQFFSQIRGFTLLLCTKLIFS